MINLLDNWSEGRWRASGWKSYWHSVDIWSNCNNNWVVLPWNISNKDIFRSWRFSWTLARCRSNTVVYQCHRIFVILWKKSFEVDKILNFQKLLNYMSKLFWCNCNCNSKFITKFVWGPASPPTPRSQCPCPVSPNQSSRITLAPNVRNALIIY